jgi:hypothetical protein
MDFDTATFIFGIMTGIVFTIIVVGTIGALYWRAYQKRLSR